MKITIETIPHHCQRYKTVGDWGYSFKLDANGHMTGEVALDINISETGNDKYNTLLIIHELIEALLCNHHGISTAEVDNWDFAHLDSDEPGAEPDCPYFDEHMFADEIERRVATRIPVSWTDYEKVIEHLYKGNSVR